VFEALLAYSHNYKQGVCNELIAQL